MTIKHISFEKLSRYRDNELFSASERSRIEEHLCCCPECKQEFMRLQKMLGMLSCIGKLEIKSESIIISHTLRTIQETGRSFNGQKAVASGEHGIRIKHAYFTAASVLFALGFILFISSPLNRQSSFTHMAQERFHSTFREGQQRAHAILRQHKVKVIEASDSYVIGEVSPNNLTTLTRRLTPHRVNIISTTGRKEYAIPASMGPAPQVGVYNASYSPGSDEGGEGVIIKVDFGQ